MKRTNLFILSAFITAILALATNGCSSRINEPETEPDSTIVYPPKNPDDISATITLCRKIDKKTGKRIGEGTVFTLMDKVKIHAYSDIKNRNFYGEKQLMFHFDWVGENGRSFYKKRIYLMPDDSSSTISSAISISPETRKPGKYILQLFLFRELIAEKKFEILPEFQSYFFEEKGRFGDIKLFRKLDKKPGDKIAGDTVFTIGKKEKIRASFHLINRSELGNRELLFRFDWAEADSTPFYRKRIDIPPDDSSVLINSSISILPEKRQAGKYTSRLYLFDKLIAEKKFELLPEPEMPEVKARIILYRKSDKKTGKLIGQGDKFKIGKKRKVRAKVKIKNRFAFNDREMKFLIEWIGPDGNQFYRKKINFAPNDPVSSIKSSISISPDKRQAGEYFLRLSLFNEVIAEKKFELSH